MTDTNKKRLYNINGTVTNLKVGTTDNTKTPYATFTLVHDTVGKEGKQKKTLVDAYGAAALKVVDGGFAVDGAKIRCGGVYKDERRENTVTGKSYNMTIFNLVHCEAPKTPEELQALRAAKQAREAVNASAEPAVA